MTDWIELIRHLILQENYLVSLHGYEEMEKDDIFLSDIVENMRNAEPIEAYPDYHKGPCCLFLVNNAEARPIHVLWGLAKGSSEPAVLITAYRPDPARWSDDFRRRGK